MKRFNGASVFAGSIASEFDALIEFLEELDDFVDLNFQASLPIFSALPSLTKLSHTFLA